MKPPRADEPAAEPDELTTLVRRLAQAEVRLQDYLAGQADTVTHGTGPPILLQQARGELARCEAVQRQAVKMQTAILDALPAHIALVDAEGVILAVNESWRRFAAANVLNSPEYGVGLNYLDLCDHACGECAEEAKPVAAGIRGVLSGELPQFSLEYSCHSSHEKRWFRLMVTPLHDGVTSRAVVMHVNTTERHLAASEVRQSEAHYRMLFAQHPHPMWVMDRTTLRYIAVNEAAVRDYGYCTEQFLGMTILDLRAANDGMDFDAAIRTLPDGFSRSIRYHRKSDGSEITVDASSDDVTFDGRPARLIMAQDITERLRAQARVTEQALLLDKAKDAILLRDLDHRVLYWNQSAARLYGWPVADAMGRSVRELLYVTPEAFDAATTHVIQHGEWTGELRESRRDGTEITVDANWTLMRDEEGRPNSILAINTDATERKKLEQQFFRAQRLESIGTLAGGIAHDLNNLLAPIVMGAGLLRQLNLPDNTKRILQTIEHSAKRGAALVKQVLSFARGVEGERVTVNLAELGDEIENIIVNTFPKNIPFKCELAPDLWPVVGDPTQLHQVLVNLCVNARDAMPHGGRLTLTARNTEIDEQFASTHHQVHPGRYVLLEVRDDGTGMPPEVIDRIFDPFFTTKDLGQGTGLGLPTSLGIVRSHGGFFDVTSEVGQGSVFQVYLPVRPPPQTEAPPVDRYEPTPHGQGELILVVDDERPILEVTQQTLEAFGYRVLTAEDGTQALAAFTQHRDEVALVITDMMMPVMDGPALIAALRGLKPEVPIIAATGLNVKANVGRAGKLGVSHFLPKPYTTNVLLSAVHQVITRSG